MVEHAFGVINRVLGFYQGVVSRTGEERQSQLRHWGADEAVPRAQVLDQTSTGKLRLNHFADVP